MTQDSKQHSSTSRFFLSNQSWRHLSKQGTFTGLLNINISCGVSLWLCSSPLAIFAHLCTSSLALLVPNSDRCPSRISNSLSTSPSQQVENVLPSVWRKMINAIQEALPLVKTLALTLGLGAELLKPSRKPPESGSEPRPLTSRLILWPSPFCFAIRCHQ